MIIVYNLFSSEHSKESAFFLMIERDAQLQLMLWLNSKIRYMGDDESLLDVDTVKVIYALVIHNVNCLEKDRQIAF